jgi:hypothetical protein
VSEEEEAREAATRLINDIAQLVREQSPGTIALFATVEHLVASLVSVFPEEGESVVLAALVSDVKSALPKMRAKRAEMDAMGDDAVALNWASLARKKGEA